LPQGEVVLFDQLGNPFSCSRVDTNADGVSELVCVPQPAADDTATDDTATDDTATDDDDDDDDE
jgi:hypothetical protein